MMCTNIEYENLMIRIFTKLISYILIYFIGYMNWSLTWILIPAIFGFVADQKKNRIWKKSYFARKAADGNEKDVILETIKELPAWVLFPDAERTEWLNKIIKQFWPFVNFYTRDLLVNFVEAKLRKNLEKYALKGFHFERVVLGSVPFRLGGIVVYDNVSRDEVVIDIDVSYAGDCDVKFRLRGLLGGIKNLQLYGKLRIVLKPLIRKLPLVGGLEVFFLNKPDIEFELDGIAGILDIPGINESLRKCVSATVSSLMVLPNRFPIKFSKEVSSDKLKTPNPAGVLRVHVIEARNLLKKDLTITGKGKSDPYAVLVVGDQTSRTDTIPCTVNPKWDFWCEFIILEFTGQEIHVTLWDEDATEDEFLGRVHIDISQLIKTGQSDMWLTLDEVKHGKLHIRSTWMTLTTDYGDLQAAVYESKQLQLAHMSSALLIVYIDSATNLRQVRSSTKPDPFIQIHLGRQIKCTNVVMRTVDPVWEEGFIFLVGNPESDYLVLKIFDSKTEAELNEVTYRIGQLKEEEHLEITKESLRLESSKNDSKLIWSLHLKVFRNENYQEYLERRPSLSSISSIETLEKECSDSSLSSSSSRPSLDGFERFGDSNRSSTRSNDSNRGVHKHLGEVNLTLKYNLHRQRLVVLIHNVCNLRFEEANEEKDIYVKVYLLPERDKANKRKTKVMKGCREPVFEKDFEFLLSQDELNLKYLEITVIEEKMIKNDILGQVVIQLKDLDLPHTASFELGPRIKGD